MSMCMYMRQVTELDARRFEKNPDALMQQTVGGTMALWAERFGGEPGDLDTFTAAFEGEIERHRPRGLFERILWWFAKNDLKTQVAKDRQTLKTVLNEGPGGSKAMRGEEVLDLHKSWHVLHFALTGTGDGGNPPANTLLLGGREIGEDLGYGPARFVEPSTISAFAALLAEIDAEGLIARLDVETLADEEIYSASVADEADEEELFEDIRHFFPMLRTFMADAAKNGQGVLIWMS